MNPQQKITLHLYNLEAATHRFQQNFIRNILEVTNWDLPTASKMLGIELDELKRKIKFYDRFNNY